MTWFKLTFTDSQGAARVILCDGVANLSVMTVKSSVLSLHMISKQNSQNLPQNF